MKHGSNLEIEEFVWAAIASARQESVMPEHSSMHIYLNWTKQRLDEMDATLASLEVKASQQKADAKAKADQLIADLKNGAMSSKPNARHRVKRARLPGKPQSRSWNRNGTASKHKSKPTSRRSANRSSSNKPCSGTLPLPT
jgi:hypothetical protein